MRVKHRAAEPMFYFLCEGLPQTSHGLFEAASTYFRYEFGLLTLVIRKFFQATDQMMMSSRQTYVEECASS